MLGNFIKATGTGGTGTQTLTSVSNFANFNDVFGTSGAARYVSYVMESADQSMRETGVGLFTPNTGNTATVARTKPLTTLSSGTLVKTNSGAVLSPLNFAAGCFVTIAATADNGVGFMPFSNTTTMGVESSSVVYSPHCTGFGGGATTADREYWQPYLHLQVGEIVAAGFYSGGGGGNVKAAIHGHTSTGAIGNQLYDFGAMPCASGMNLFAPSGLWLPLGWYWIGKIFSSNPSCRLTTAMSPTWVGNAGGAYPAFQFYRSGNYTTGLTNPATLTSMTAVYTTQSGVCPSFGLRCVNP